MYDLIGLVNIITLYVLFVLFYFDLWETPFVIVLIPFGVLAVTFDSILVADYLLERKAQRKEQKLREKYRQYK